MRVGVLRDAAQWDHSQLISLSLTSWHLILPSLEQTKLIHSNETIRITPFVEDPSPNNADEPLTNASIALS